MGVNKTSPEQFQLRLPPGLRDRVKAYAELQGRSTNAEIVRILEREFPEPESIEGRVSDLVGLTQVLKGGASNPDVEKLTWTLLDTIRRLADGTIQGLDEEARSRIYDRLGYWEESFAEDENERATEGLDRVEIEALEQGRSTAKFPLDREWRRYVRSLSGREMTEGEEDAFQRGVESERRWREQRGAKDLTDENPFE